MVERHSHVADSPDPRRLGMEWFLDAVFPNGRTVTIRGFARDCETSECPGGFRYVKSAPDSCRVLGKQATVLFSSNENVRTPSVTPVPVVSPERAPQILSNLPCLMSIATRSLGRLTDKWRAATSSPWFPLLCAGVSFAVLLVVTGAFAGMALTKQPVRMDMTAGPGVGAITLREQPKLIRWSYDNDPIATLIERTSHPEPPEPLPPTPEEVERALRRLMFP